MKQIIPHKLIISLNQDGTFKSGILQYKLKIDEIEERQFRTLGITQGINQEEINKVLEDAKSHAEQGEGI
ncbi:MAG: hypothetical protein ABSB18_06425 [Candidatus Omnitrophota bacterium]